MPIKTYSGPPVTILVRVPKQAKQCNNLRRRVNRSRFVRAPLAAQQVLAAAGMDQRASQDASLCTPSSLASTVCNIFVQRPLLHCQL